ncbi:hypothetical protein [Pedobacter sp. L105]|uniref:hypothetical protein n=1 Tax=Pedobacter sp. L105 TaxID=1641871 RepID=UPI00131AB2CC|nr:hypothetical protein [Pedobacter sp. L105]
MRRSFLLLFICSVFSIRAYSQLNGNYNYSISLTGFTLLQNPKIFEQDPQKYITSYVNGGMVKLNDNQISYRFGGSFVQKNISFEKDCTNCNIANGKITDYTFKIGFEKNFGFSNIQPYFAFDLGYRYNRFKGYMNTLNNQQAVAASNAAEETKNGLTLAPAIGVKIDPTDKITIFAESSLQFYYAHDREGKGAANSLGITGINSFSKGEFLINPITMGMQVHFGNKN